MAETSLISELIHLLTALAYLGGKYFWYRGVSKKLKRLAKE